jgi:hypothetical protein
MTYSEKLTIADNYINRRTYSGMGWNDLPDINSLHDVEAIEDIRELCIARLEEAGFNFDDDEEDEDTDIQNMGHVPEEEELDGRDPYDSEADGEIDTDIDWPDESRR